jgi:uncharacterized membrane protein
VRRILDSVNVGLMAAMLAFAIWAWPDLPEQIPTHFGIDGRPDAWGHRTFLSWFGLPLIAVGLTLALYGFRLVMPRHPRWVNLPDRRRLSDLPEAARGPVLEMLSGFLALIQTHLLVIFAVIQLASYRSALGEGSQGAMLLVLLMAVLASPVFLVVFFLRFQRAMEEGKRLAAQEAPEERSGAGEDSVKGDAGVMGNRGTASHHRATHR